MRSGCTALGCACNVWILRQSEHCMVQGVYGVVSPMVVSFAHFVYIFLLKGLQHSRIPIYNVVRSDYCVNEYQFIVKFLFFGSTSWVFQAISP